MPRRPLRTCGHPGCRALVERGRCLEHALADRRAYDAERGSAAARGYGHRWRQYRRWYLLLNPLCAVCGRAATDVDHVEAVSGPDDPLFWEPANHQALCHGCHAAKTNRSDGGYGRHRAPPVARGEGG